MKDSVLRILNALTLLITLAVNGYGGAVGFNGRNVGEVSDAYPTFITPAGYAFSIWSVIYLLLIGFVVYQFVGKRREDLIQQVGPWFIVSNLANSAWIVAFLSEAFGLSVLLMFTLLFSLVVMVVRLRIATWDGGLREIFFVWWPIAIYLGWIVAASVVNVAATLVAAGWEGAPFSPELWSIIMISIATLVYLFLIATRNLRESAGVGIWAILAISVAMSEKAPSVAVACYVAIGILSLAILGHGYLNRATNPFGKLMRGEW